MQSPLDQANTHRPGLTMNDPTPFDPATTTVYYRVVAQNTVGYGQGMPQMTAVSTSNRVVVGPQFTITASAGANGSITPSGDVAVGAGGSETFTFTPDPHYRISEVLVDGAPDAAAVAAGSYTFTNVQANHTIAVSFTLSDVTITSTAGPGGSIAPKGKQTVRVNGTEVYTITAHNHYHILDVKVDGVSQPGAVGLDDFTYTFTNLVADHTIDATFEPDVYTITSSAGPHGTITPLGPQPVVYNHDLTFTIAADTGYHLREVLVDGVADVGALTTGSYTFTKVSTDHTIRVTFEANPTISVTTPNGGEDWVVGTRHFVRWNSAPAIGRVLPGVGAQSRHDTQLVRDHFTRRRRRDRGLQLRPRVDRGRPGGFGLEGPRLLLRRFRRRVHERPVGCGLHGHRQRAGNDVTQRGRVLDRGDVPQRHVELAGRTHGPGTCAFGLRDLARTPR